MRRTSRLTTFLAALLVLAATAAAASASNGTTITRSDVTGSTISCDNGSLIATVTAGSFQTVVHETQTPSGAYHLIIEATAQGVQAATPSGTNYLIPGGFHSEQNVTPGATTSNYSAPLNVIGQGGAPNFTTRAVFHTTVTANGDVTASVDHFTSTGNCAV